MHIYTYANIALQAHHDGAEITGLFPCRTRPEDLTGHTVHIDRRILDFVVGLDTAGKTGGGSR